MEIITKPRVHPENERDEHGTEHEAQLMPRER